MKNMKTICLRNANVSISIESGNVRLSISCDDNHTETEHNTETEHCSTDAICYNGDPYKMDKCNTDTKGGEIW